MRKWHRWISLVTSVVMGFIAFTGLLLQLDLWVSGHAPPGSAPGSDRAPLIEGYRGLHNTFQDWHAGYFLGTTGRVISVLMALGLLTLSITGIVMYVQMYGARKRIKRHGLFWK
ncbi:MAG: hypothetical protein QM718_04755 [Steroidobacteraceae bacterium]